MPEPGGPQNHVVHFYDDDEQLAVAVSAFVGEGLHRGEVALLVASQEHLRVFEADLAAGGIDVDALRADGSLVELDAADALDAFMVGDAPDPLAFEATIGRLVRAAHDRGPVRVYGEMVALLWAEGLVPAVMELEALWNDLGSDVAFSLFCAYPASSMADGGRSEFARVCHLHSEVLGSGSPRSRPRGAGYQEVRTRSFTCTLASPRAARGFLAEALNDWGATAVEGDAAVIVTELAANAVLHAQTDFELMLTRGPRALEICVVDSAFDVPLPRDPAAHIPSGRGLRLVAGLAARWGTEFAPGSKLVWAEVALPARP